MRNGSPDTFARLMGDLSAAPADESGEARPRRSFVLDDTGFNKVPMRFRRFYRRWRGPQDVLAPNEALCPVCKVVIRSTREFRAGDLVYCMPCMSRLVLVEERAVLIAKVIY